ncbi:TnsA endonuclease N-terminal domain-containing protein [Paraglaciecola hydrolytica]|uniref:TnsA endonuclease N-terminal domain-containing protein n=1 Tax=Paraglaciecola hydrolytica TaxID=1799789 RepID=A0A148KL62_9ALTE|nr:TnsA endonuclease N-terminal domain-containing protein [Paraglaciecola hydrolytica]KXI27043.1 hypothetical protein AX660_02115 [Paraglaciecola hydrolytica]
MIVKQPVVTQEIVESVKLWQKEVADYGYSPWVKISDVRKFGRRHFHRCDKQGRIVHLLSDGEYRSYQILLWRPNVLAVYEQVPLDLSISLDIARELNIVHHRNYKDNSAYIATTDFLVKHIDVKTGEIIYTAYSFKYWDQFFQIDENGVVIRRKGRIIQKLKIEREYWRRKGIAFKLISEKDTTKDHCWNLDWFTQEWDAELEQSQKLEFSEAFLESWYIDKFASIQKHIDFACDKLVFNSKEGITLFKVCALEQILPLDLSKKLKLYYPVNVIGNSDSLYV